MNRNPLPDSGNGQGHQGRNGNLLRLLQIIFSAKNAQTQQKEVLECLGSTPELLHLLLQAAPSSSISPSSDQTDQNRARPIPNPSKADDVITGRSQTDGQFKSKMKDNGKEEKLTPSKKFNEKRKESNESFYRGTIQLQGKRKRSSNNIDEISETEYRAVRDRENKSISTCNYSGAALSNNEVSTDSNVVSDDVLLSRRMLDILMHPPSIHHQRAVISVLKSDEKLRKVFNEERVKIGAAKIPVFKESPKSPNSTAIDKSEDDDTRRYLPSQNDTHTLQFSIPQCGSQEKESVSYHNNLTRDSKLRSTCTMTAPTCLETNESSTFSSYAPSVEEKSEDGLLDENMSQSLTPPCQQGTESILYLTPFPGYAVTSPSDPSQLTNNEPTFEPAFLDIFQQTSSEMHTINNSLSYSSGTECISVVEENDTGPVQVYDATSTGRSEDIHLNTQNDDMMNSFFELLEQGPQMSQMQIHHVYKT